MGLVEKYRQRVYVDDIEFLENELRGKSNLITPPLFRLRRFEIGSKDEL